uniref:Uncharacterized protein n=1 Tax=Rhizophora mucronata TaxID=61149 RepID=A0A2P2NNM6_RHIMU
MCKKKNLLVYLIFLVLGPPSFIEMRLLNH